MKTLMISLLCTFFAITGIAQETIEAEKIIQMINKQEKVSLENVIVSGDLDFTRLDNMDCEKQAVNRTCKSRVEVPV